MTDVYRIVRVNLPRWGFRIERYDYLGESPLAEPKMLSKWEIFVAPAVWKCEFQHVLVCTGSCNFVYYMGGGKLTCVQARAPGKVIVLA